MVPTLSCTSWKRLYLSGINFVILKKKMFLQFCYLLLENWKRLRRTQRFSRPRMEPCLKRSTNPQFTHLAHLPSRLPNDDVGFGSQVNQVLWKLFIVNWILEGSFVVIRGSESHTSRDPRTQSNMAVFSRASSRLAKRILILPHIGNTQLLIYITLQSS